MNTEPPTARFGNGESFAAARLSQTLNLIGAVFTGQHPADD